MTKRMKRTAVCALLALVPPIAIAVGAAVLERGGAAPAAEGAYRDTTFVVVHVDGVAYAELYAASFVILMLTFGAAAVWRRRIGR